MRRLLGLAIALLLFLSPCLFGQRRFGTNSTSPTYTDLSVVVRMQNGGQIPGSVKIELLNGAGITVSSAFANSDGEATISNVLSGTTYVLRITGEKIQPTTAEVFLQTGEADHTEWVDVSPRTTETQPTAKGGSIAAVDLNVPPDAQKELDAGNELFKQQKWDEAGQHYQKAIDIYPKYAMAYKNLGSVRMQKKDVAGAKDAYQHAVAINDKYAGAWMNLAQIAYDEHDLQGVETDLQKVLVADPANVQALSTLAQTEMQLGKFDLSEQYVQKANAMPHPGLAIIHVVGAFDYQKLNKPADALAEYKKYLEEDPNGPMAPKVRATIQSLEAQKTNP